MIYLLWAMLDQHNKTVLGCAVRSICAEVFGNLAGCERLLERKYNCDFYHWVIRPWSGRGLVLGPPLVAATPWLWYDRIVGTCNTDNGTFLILFMILWNLMVWFPGSQGIRFTPIWNKHHFSQGLAPALHTAGLARHPAGGGTTSLDAIFGPQVLVFGGRCCPGPGNSWGNLAAPPASTDAESPSMSFHSTPPPDCITLPLHIWLTKQAQSGADQFEC